MIKRISVPFKRAQSGVLACFFAFTAGTIALPIPIRIAMPPAVFIVSENEYAVMWATNRRGTGSLIVTAGGTEHVFHDASGGTLRSDDTLHTVRVPKAVLDGCDSYRVQSRYVLSNRGYYAFSGLWAESGAYAFRGYAGQEEVRALFFTDVHGKRKQAARNAAALTREAPANLVILGGDMCETKRKKDFIKGILGPAAGLSGGSVPVLYCRGNHEARGQWATELRRYFPTETGEMYFTADYGPVSFTVLDTGEDKDDSHREYFGMADFAVFRARQEAWLRELPQASGYVYRVCVSHMGELDQEGFFNNWFEPLRDNLGITHVLCGHGHENRTWVNNDVRCYEDGGPDTGSLLVFSGGEIQAQSAASPGEIKDFGKLG